MTLSGLSHCKSKNIFPWAHQCNQYAILQLLKHNEGKNRIQDKEKTCNETNDHPYNYPPFVTAAATDVWSYKRRIQVLALALLRVNFYFQMRKWQGPKLRKT